MEGRTAIVLKGYPRLSETFIAQEIRGLERLGHAFLVVSLRHPTDRERHPLVDEIQAPVLYLPEYLSREPARLLRAWAEVRRRPGYGRARALWLADLRRDPTANRVRRFGQAVVLAHELGEDVRHLHAHFLHTPASVARYAAVLAGLEWSVSAHAVDVWTTPEWELSEKLAHCAWAVTCTEVNRQRLAVLAPHPGKVGRVYHGLDPARIHAREPAHSERDGSDPADPVHILSVGRAVEKKGYADLLAALARLADDLHWRFVHIGDGPLLGDLKANTRRLGLTGRIDWLGARAQGAVLAAQGEADLFALACRVAANGDRDGLPNVLMEAQAQGVAVLSTRLSAIPELVSDGETGLLAEPGDVAGLADRLARLIQNPDLRRTLGEAGRRRLARDFSFAEGLRLLDGRLRPRAVSRVA